MQFSGGSCSGDYGPQNIVHEFSSASSYANEFQHTLGILIKYSVRPTQVITPGGKHCKALAVDISLSLNDLFLCGSVRECSECCLLV